MKMRNFYNDAASCRCCWFILVVVVYWEKIGMTKTKPKKKDKKKEIPPLTTPVMPPEKIACKDTKINIDPTKRKTN